MKFYSNRRKIRKGRRLFLDLAHFKNLWILLIRRYRELYGYYSIKDEKLAGFLKALKKQKRKVDNSYLLQQVIRDIVKSLKENF